VEWLIGLGLVLITVAAYSPCLDHPFIHFDDPDYVTANPHVQAGLTVEGIRWAFTTGDCGNWHPLTWLSLQLDATLYGGGNSSGFHRTNVLLHLISTVLLFLVLSRMTGMAWRSAMVAALFALHPLNVESVAWVAERKGVLSTFFWMLGLAAYLYYVRQPSVRRYLLVVMALVLGLMAKPMLVTLPFVFLLLDYWPLGRLQKGNSAIWNLKSAILEKLPLFGVVLAWSVIAFLTQLQIKALPSLEAYPLNVRIWNALLAYVGYLGKLFWPVHLSVYYPHPGAAVPVVSALIAWIVLVVITVLVLSPGRRWPYLAVGWLWYLGTLVPVSGLVQIGSHAMADRYAYVPMIGLYLMLTWGAADLMMALRLPRRYGIVIPVLALSVCGILTWTQADYWKSDADLWQHALAVTERNAMAHHNLGMHYRRLDQVAQAKKEFAEAVALDPDLSLYHRSLATALRDLGRWDEAVTECRKAIVIDAQDSDAHLTLGNLFHDRGQWEEALAEKREAVRLAPEYAPGHYQLARLFYDLGRRDEAMMEHQQAIDLDSTYASPHIGMGNVLMDLGRRKEAITAFRRAAQLVPQEPETHFNLGLALQAEGNLDEALSEYRQAQAAPLYRLCAQLQYLRSRLPGFLAGRDKPANSVERLGFADLCAQPFEGRYALAVRLYTEAFREDPALATDLRTTKRTDAAIAAVQAASGLGQDATGLDEKEKARLRQQALDWLQADLALLAEWAPAGKPQAARTIVQQKLRLWQHDAGLAGVREPAALGKLPETEREAWQKLWQDVEAGIAQTLAGSR
jgi:tetratricopeptide (TPR) repeat protein